MKAGILKERLRWAIGAAEKITGKNLSLPTLAYVLVEAKNKNLFVKATNLDLGIKINLPAKVEADGQVMIAGGIVANFLGSLYGQDKVELATTLNALTVPTSSTKSVIKTYSADDFPTIPEVAGGEEIQLSAVQFIHGLKAVAYAAANSDIKPEIASVYLYHQNGELVFVATDSFRLAEKRVKLDQKITTEPKLIIPIRNIMEVMRIFEGNDELLTVKYNNHQVAFITEQIYLTSRLVEGVFPDYRQIVPTSRKTEVVILKNDLLNTMRLSTIFADKLNQINLKIITADKLLEINSRNSDVGETTINLDATLEGEDIEISLNARYLLDCLSSIAADSLIVSFNGRQRPIMLKGVGDAHFTYLIMPLNR